MITDDNENWYYLAVKSIFRLLRGITSNNNGESQIVFIHTEQKKDLKNMKKYAKIMIIVM